MTPEAAIPLPLLIVAAAIAWTWLGILWLTAPDDTVHGQILRYAQQLRRLRPDQVDEIRDSPELRADLDPVCTYAIEHLPDAVRARIVDATVGWPSSRASTLVTTRTEGIPALAPGRTAIDAALWGAAIIVAGPSLTEPQRESLRAPLRAGGIVIR